MDGVMRINGHPLTHQVRQQVADEVVHDLQDTGGGDVGLLETHQVHHLFVNGDTRNGITAILEETAGFAESGQGILRSVGAGSQITD
jgi:hypothetical protein